MVSIKLIKPSLITQTIPWMHEKNRTNQPGYASIRNSIKLTSSSLQDLSYDQLNKNQAIYFVLHVSVRTIRLHWNHHHTYNIPCSWTHMLFIGFLYNKKQIYQIRAKPSESMYWFWNQEGQCLNCLTLEPLQQCKISPQFCLRCDPYSPRTPFPTIDACTSYLNSGTYINGMVLCNKEPFLKKKKYVCNVITFFTYFLFIAALLFSMIFEKLKYYGLCWNTIFFLMKKLCLLYFIHLIFTFVKNTYNT